MLPEAALVDRFRKDLDALIAPGARFGIAVSGGPDSLALLLLTAAAMPDRVEAATVDHALRAGSREEADMVAGLCEKLAIPHAIFTVDWPVKPESALQAQARDARYALLARWVRERGLDALLTAHQLDDQAETFAMRLNRGAGVRGLSAMRAVSVVPGSNVPLMRPLLGWRRSELGRICAEAGIAPVADPSNEDTQFERVRIRNAMAHAQWLDPQSLAASASHLGEADAALEWAATQEWAHSVANGGGQIRYRPGSAPPEIRRRIISAAVARLAGEGDGDKLRGGELDRLLATLGKGNQATLRGVLCVGGEEWSFSKAPPRKG
jgi:tRNA(Ile)-lysidine synthase